MLKVAKAALAAEKNLRRTVEYARPEVLDEAAELIQQGERDVYLFGVKNTKQISWNLIDKLTAAGYLFHTIDSMARGGRAIDVDLVNPLTGGVMTGSSRDPVLTFCSELMILPWVQTGAVLFWVRQSAPGFLVLWLKDLVSRVRTQGSPQTRLSSSREWV